jgi:hypothetical protein
MARYKKKIVQQPINEDNAYEVIENFKADIADKYISGKKGDLVLLTDNEAAVLLNANKVRKV